MDPLDSCSSEARLRLGDHVRALRARTDWSVDELAARVGMSTSALLAVEQGTADIGLSELATLAEAFGEPISALVSSEPSS